ncbi:hypothetical protein [Paenibacillus hexagrammi]|uniref:Acetyl-CoA acetyltransferase n=1 Tax=Paenibacillus hexagrammi TaxID=2908839 RepID=A0ABY3SI63_9BACL|nr:hypothetical protein [Paenibacillus sp. YPD9-1]UJF32916.1 hypothetical protein L0M14_25620 [Paenibacillus sp. YPD9-1]
MYTNPSHHHGSHVIYQADPSWMPALKQKREALLSALKPHVGRTIRVQTLDGHTYEGVLVNVDGHHAYIQVNTHGHHPHQGTHRGFYGPSSQQILTLVLYELLVILLLA